MAHEVLARFRLDAVFSGPLFDGVHVERDQSDDVLLLISVEMNLRNKARGLQETLEFLWSHIFATRRFQKVFFTIGDAQVTFG